MAGTITAIEVQKNNKERVNVYIDEKYALAVTVTVATGLRKGQSLSDEEIERLRSQDETTKAYHRAIFYLGFRSRSQSEMEKYLRDKDYSEHAIARTIDRLKQEEYLNDDEFAQSWVENRERFKPRSRRALRYELRRKGVSDSAIDNALDDLDEEDSAWRAIEGKLRQWQKLDEPDFRKKAMGYLSRRGFNYSTARQAVDRAWELLTEEPL